MSHQSLLQRITDILQEVPHRSATYIACGVLVDARGAGWRVVAPHDFYTGTYFQLPAQRLSFTILQEIDGTTPLQISDDSAETPTFAKSEAIHP